MADKLVRYSTDLSRDHWIRRQMPRKTSLRGYAEEYTATAVIVQLRNLIKSSGQSRADVAKQLGVTRSQVSQWLNGYGNPTLNTVAAILWACGRQVESLKLAPVAGSKMSEQHNDSPK